MIEWPHDNGGRRPKSLPGHISQAKRNAQIHRRLQLPPPNPSGLCQCGCGEVTPIAKIGSRAQGYVLGEHTRYAGPSHAVRGKRWSGTSIRGIGGYTLLRVPDHPDVNPKGYVLEHRLVMERELGRRLLPTEHIHHVNGDKTDNRPNNLIVLSRKDHGKLHGRPVGIPHTAEYRAEQSARMTRWWAERKARLRRAR